jgi:hypothetical protein
VGIAGKPGDWKPSASQTARERFFGWVRKLHPGPPGERESLAKKAAAIFDVNPIVVRLRLDSLFDHKAFP